MGDPENEVMMPVLRSNWVASTPDLDTDDTDSDIVGIDLTDGEERNVDTNNKLKSLRSLFKLSFDKNSELDAELLQQNKQNAKLNEKLDEFSALIAKLETDKEAIESDNLKLSDKFAETQVVHANLEKNAQNLRENIEQIKNELQAANNTNTQLINEKDKLSELLATSNADIKAKDFKIANLE